METKKQIRQEILSLRDGVSVKEREKMSEKLFERLSSLPEFKDAKNVLLFAGYGSEPNTYPFIEYCLGIGKRVFCPCVEGEEMEFYEISSSAQLIAGYRGIMEPAASAETRYQEKQGDFMMIPGTVFDRDGNRIGYGKGFYDRYLSNRFTGTTAAVAFSFQIIESGRIPAELTDRKMKCIVTEQEIIRI